jgi:hypothetical protein
MLLDKCKNQGQITRGHASTEIATLGKISMPLTFGYVHNTRTKDITFDIFDMKYSYNAISDSETLKAFEAILHPPYLYMKGTV